MYKIIYITKHYVLYYTYLIFCTDYSIGNLLSLKFFQNIGEIYIYIIVETFFNITETFGFVDYFFYSSCLMFCLNLFCQNFVIRKWRI